ncbi:hypothetical protein QWZ06_08700 [Chryseobacterium tructae]|uniref:Uncharacterized protein n=1 Tax=Chryseobacterium tructae TaxID=1037380 RepID=A0ABV7XVW1_9FLAO|nr:hypothetical protein [Chryseobacterium tructae]MDN3692336.1 hypothetical protein [Chryseobacterium tructae]
MKNFETEQKEFENVQKRTNHIALYPFLLAGEKAHESQTESNAKRKTKETGRAILLFLLK